MIEIPFANYFERKEIILIINIKKVNTLVYLFFY
jgi:hypothetical protein